MDEMPETNRCNSRGNSYDVQFKFDVSLEKL